MAVERFIPENPYESPGIPVDDMNNGFYINDNHGGYPMQLPLCWYQEDGRVRQDLRVLPDEELAKLGWFPAEECPLIDPETGNTAVWNFETKQWDIVPISSLS